MTRIEPPLTGLCEGDTATFYLGTHEPSWLQYAPPEVALFVSRRRLERRVTLPVAPPTRSWALDSGGFSELRMYGGWTITPTEYVRVVARYEQEIGRLDWAAPMDWMCEPPMLKRTGLTIGEHQAHTVRNFVQLQELWPTYSSDSCPFMPVLQGWRRDDYLRCLDLYTRAGIDLADWPIVGLGSVCRRQATSEIERIVRALAPLPLHGFGCKTAGLGRYGQLLASADSLAWSYGARYKPPLDGCTHRNCANCQRYALAWRGRVLTRLAATTPESEVRRAA